jgi:hypothetical protein
VKVCAHCSVAAMCLAGLVEKFEARVVYNVRLGTNGEPLLTKPDMRYTQVVITTPSIYKNVDTVPDCPRVPPSSETANPT